MHGLFGAVRLYLVNADRIERDFASRDDGSVASRRVGAWAVWARARESCGPVDPLPRVSRVVGTVHNAAAGRLRPD